MDPARPSPIFPGRPRPLLFGHRGASRYAPENTLDAFDLALRLGADVLELDVHGSKDGEVVVIHDETVDRTTNGTGRVKDLTYRELNALDAGYRFGDASGACSFRDRGLYVPRLLDVLRAFPAVALNIEIKQREPSMVRQVLQVLDEAGCAATDRLLSAADDRIMAEIEAARPGCALGLSRAQVLRVLQAPYFKPLLGPRRGVPERYAGRALQIPLRYKGVVPIATVPVVRAAHDAGLEVHLWTVNSPSKAELWLGRGVDGIISDDPGGLAGLFRDARAAGGSRARHRRSGMGAGPTAPK